MADMVPVNQTPLARVALLLDIKKDPQQFTDNEKLVLTAVAMFKGLLDNTFSGDVLHLAIYNAMGNLRGLVPEEEVRELATRLITTLRTPSPMDSMFAKF